MHARSAACRDCGRSMLRFDARTIFGRRSGQTAKVVAAVIRKRYAARTRALL
jgi:hypothetical protein